MKPLDLVGQKFGKLKVLSNAGSTGKSTIFLCLCDCGVEKVLVGVELKRGKLKSCGCSMGKPITTKPYRNHPLYDVWKGMKARCYDKNHISYHRYGGKGVVVCELWRTDFKPFYDWCIANGWKKGLQIDKDIKAKELGLEPNLYSPERCQFVTCAINCRDKDSIKLSIDIATEIRMSNLRRCELAKKYKVNVSTIDKIKKNKIWKK